MREARHERPGATAARGARPERLWSLPPATFSDGEQQRLSIARGFAGRHPVLLLDGPTASLDAASRARVFDLIAERREAPCSVSSTMRRCAASWPTA